MVGRLVGKFNFGIYFGFCQHMALLMLHLCFDGTRGPMVQLRLGGACAHNQHGSCGVSCSEPGDET